MRRQLNTVVGGAVGRGLVVDVLTEVPATEDVGSELDVDDVDDDDVGDDDVLTAEEVDAAVPPVVDGVLLLQAVNASVTASAKQANAWVRRCSMRKSQPLCRRRVRPPQILNLHPSPLTDLHTSPR